MYSLFQSKVIYLSLSEWLLLRRRSDVVKLSLLRCHVPRAKCQQACAGKPTANGDIYEPVTLVIFFTMADILTLVFKSFITRGSKQFNVLLPSTCSTLVIGDKNISRSLLLFAAVKAASEMGMKVLFLTQTQIKSLPASLQHCMSSLSPDNLKVQQMTSYILHTLYCSLVIYFAQA